MWMLSLLHGGDLRSAGLITPKMSLSYIVCWFLLVKGKVSVLATVKNESSTFFDPSHLAFCQPRGL